MSISRGWDAANLKAIIPVQNKFLYTFESEGYDLIFGANATGNLEAEDEAEASTADVAKLSMKSHKGLPMDEGSSLAKKSWHIPA